MPSCFTWGSSGCHSIASPRQPLNRYAARSRTDATNHRHRTLDRAQRSCRSEETRISSTRRFKVFFSIFHQSQQPQGVGSTQASTTPYFLNDHAHSFDQTTISTHIESTRHSRTNLDLTKRKRGWDYNHTSRHRRAQATRLKQHESCRKRQQPQGCDNYISIQRHETNMASARLVRRPKSNRGGWGVRETQRAQRQQKLSAVFNKQRDVKPRYLPATGCFQYLRIPPFLRSEGASLSPLHVTPISIDLYKTNKRQPPRHHSPSRPDPPPPRQL